MAHGWDSYFHGLQPLPTDSKTLEVSSELEAQPTENFLGHHDEPNMGSSDGATNTDFSSNCYSNSVLGSDCVYQKYYGNMPWQADGHQSVKDGSVKDGSSKCESSSTTNFAADELSTSGDFSSSFATDFHEIKQDCETLNPPFLENYSDVSSCSENEINETRPSCKFMKSATNDIDTTQKHNDSGWPFTPTGNMSISVDDLCPHISNTQSFQSYSVFDGEARENMADCAEAEIGTENLSTSLMQKDQISDTKNLTGLSSSSIEHDKEDLVCQEQQQQTLDVEEERALKLKEGLDSPIQMDSADNWKENPDPKGDENKDNPKDVPFQPTTSVTIGECLVDKVKETVVKESGSIKNKETCDIKEALGITPSSATDQEKITKDESPCRKLSCSEDGTHELDETTLKAISSADCKSDMNSVQDCSQNVQSSLHFHSPLEDDKCEIMDPCDKSQDGSGDMESSLQLNDSGMEVNPCRSSESTSPGEQTAKSCFVEHKKSSPSGLMAIEPQSASENTEKLFQERTEERPIVDGSYGEPLSGEDSPLEHDEKSESTQLQESLVTRPENLQSLNHLDAQAVQPESFVHMQKRLQPIVVLKTLEPRDYIKDKYTCAYCKHSSQNVDNLIEHHCSHTLHKFKFCSTCNIYVLNDGEEKHSCGITDEGSSISLDTKLKKKKRSLGSYKCNSCGYRFIRYYQYVRHIRTHTGKTPFKCNGCGNYFSQGSSLYKHKRIPGRCHGIKHEVSVPHIDAVISKTQNPVTQKDLACRNLHRSLPECYVKLVDVGRSNACSFCGKFFTSKETQSKHVCSVHKLQAEKCEFSETSKSICKDKTTYTGGKYQCPLCPRAFKYSYNRARHLCDCVREVMMNDNGKIGERYQCPLCNATFITTGNRRRHIKNSCLKEYLNLARTNVKDTGEQKTQRSLSPGLLDQVQRFKCSLCPARFSFSSGKSKHMKKHRSFQIPVNIVNQDNKDSQDCKKTTECKDTSTSSETNSSNNEQKNVDLSTNNPINSRRIQCTVCKKILPTIGELLQHRTSHLKRGMLQCPECPMQFKFPVYLLRHIKTHRHRERKARSFVERPQLKPDLAIQPLKEQTETNTLQCSLCKDVFHDAQTMRKHHLKHLSRSSSLQCPFCKRHFNSRRYLIRHTQSHSGDKPFFCSACGRGFYRLDNLAMHQNTCASTTIEPVSTPKNTKSHKYTKQCSYCPRLFTRKKRLMKHHHGHKSNSLVLCSRCGQYFGATKLSQHLRQCTGPTQNNILTSGSQSDGFLKKDIQKPNETTLSGGNGTATIPHHCPHCRKKFRFKSLLLRHLLSHAPKQSYACMHCGHKYGTKSLCVKHEAFCDGIGKKLQYDVKSDGSTKLLQGSRLRETKEKRSAEGDYKCKFCTKTFMKPRSLRRHILTHTEVKPYRCKACDSSFSRYDYLKVHQTHCTGKRGRLEVCIPKISLDAVGKGWKNNIGILNINEQQRFGCHHCLSSFSSESNLRRHVTMLHARQTYSTRLSTSECHEKSLKSQSESTTLLHDEISQILKPHTDKKQKHACMYCPRSFKLNHQLNVHTRLHTGEKPFLCDCCGQRFIRRDYLLRHSAKCNHKRGEMDLTPNDGNSGIFPEVKPEIHKESSIRPSFSDHIQQSTSQSPAKGFSCAYCSSSFLIFSELQQHFLNAHKQDTVLKSPMSISSLQQQFSTIQSIKEEPLDEVDADQPLSGDGNLLFPNRNSLNDKVKPFSCLYCKLRFQNKAGLSGHVRIHFRKSPFSCRVCKKGFWNRYQQRNHSRKCNLGKYCNLKSSSTKTSEMDLALNDSVIVFNHGSKTTGTGVLQTNFSCKDDSENGQERSEESQERNNSSTEKKAVHYQCSECDQSFTDGLMLISHLEDHGRLDQQKKSKTCPKCGKVCSSQANLEDHMQLHDNDKIYSCDECSKRFASVKALRHHKVYHKPKTPFACKVCLQRFCTTQSLYSHYNETHPNDLYTCQLCNISYASKKSLVRHNRMRHQNKQAEYSNCTENEEKNTEQVGIEVNTNGESDEDLDFNEGSENDGSEGSDSDAAPYFPCHVCGKTFMTSESLEDHQRCHLGEKPHECAECGKCFFQASQLQQHQRMHKSEFQCQICRRGFVSLFALRKHKHTHGKSRPYRCSKCDLSFTGPSQLAEHMATHREDNFPCDICNRSFSCKSSRAEHRKTHSEAVGSLPPLTPQIEMKAAPIVSTLTEQLKYRCGVCHKRFKDPEELSEHGCMAASERPYSCSDCDMHFLHESHLKKHRATHQPSKLPVYPVISFSSHHSYVSHLKQQVKTVKSKDGAAEDDSVTSILKCSVCNERFANAIELKNHMLVHSDDAHECNICKLIFPTKNKREEHERSHLTAAALFECTECGKKCLGRDTFRQHNCSRASKKGRDSCPSSKVPDSHQTVGEEEEVDVTGEDSYNCIVCSKRFSSKSILLEHQNKHYPNDKLLKCGLCGKAFHCQRDLILHERMHNQKEIRKERPQPKTIKKQLSCFHCHLLFDTVHEMSLHMKMHTEQKVGHHRCDMCYKSFSQLSILRHHQESHVGQVVYECTECDKAFAFPHLLEEHQQSHAGPSQ